MTVPTLGELARRACIRNIRAIIDIGDATYEQVRPVLLRVQNPDQLNELESNCPQLIGHTAEIWRAIIKRDIEGFSSEEPPEPSNPASWYKLYRKLRRKEQQAIHEQEEMLAGQLRNLKESAAGRTSKVVDAKALPRLNRALGGRVEKKPSTTIARSGDFSKLRFMSGSRTKTTSGQDVLNRARREAKEMSLFSMRGNSSLARPSHELAQQASAPRAPPKTLIGEHQRLNPSKGGEVSTGSIAVPRRGSVARTITKRDSGTYPGNPQVQIHRTSPATSHKEDTVQEFQRTMSKVPRVAPRSPDKREKPLKKTSPRARDSDIFMPAKKKRKA